MSGTQAAAATAAGAGYVVVMGRSGGVSARIRWAVDLLHLRPEDRILEIGCGAGVAVALVCDRLDGGQVTGVDRSATAIERARARNAEHVAAGRALLLREELARLGAPGPFDTAFAVNVNVFWTGAADAECAALSRLLRPAGSLRLVYEMPAAVDRRNRVRHAKGNLERHGFATEWVEHPVAPLVCITGHARR